MARRAGPSRSQPSQRARDQRDDEDDYDSDDDDARNVDADNDMEVDSDERHLEKKARDLVRLALFYEHKRVPLRREDIMKKVLGTYKRSFNAVFSMAQALLHTTFAMELVKLQARNFREQDLNEEQNATGVKKKAASSGSTTYILRSTLDAAIIEQASLSDERLLEEELAEGPDDEDDEDDMPRNYGSIIAWSTADQLAAMGLLHVILALILVNGRGMSELDFKANLRRLRITPNSTVPLNAQSTHRNMSIDTFLQNLVRQGYIHCVHLGDIKSTTGKRRARPSAAQGNAEENPQSYEWRWGNRAHSEIGERAVASFVGEFMVEQNRLESAEAEEAEGARGTGRRRGKQAQKDGGLEKQLETMLKGIEKAAGGDLADIN